MIARLALGAVASAAVSVVGWRANALNSNGAIAATVVGTGIAAGSSWRGLVVLGTFFVSSSALSRGRQAGSVESKGSRRDERQVLANGGVAALGALVGSRQHPVLSVGLVAGALAAATADTWATELGAGSPVVPRLIVSGRAVPGGTSGGVTPRGSVAALGGAALIGVVSGALMLHRAGPLTAVQLGVGVSVAGVAGSVIDSVLGEIVQERRHCLACDVRTEASVHQCGAATVHAGGIRGFDNDVVNLACTAVGCLLVIPFAAVPKPVSWR